MRQISCKLITIIVLLAAVSCPAQNNDSNSIKTVEQLYPNLTSGALTYAKVETMPEDILLKAEGLEITQKDIDQFITKQPQQIQTELKNNAFFMLEQETAKRLLLDLARKTLAQPGKESTVQEESALLQQFFEKEVFKTIEVTDEELKAFYENNKDMCGGATLEQVGASLKDYMISQKQQKMISDYIQTLGTRIPMQVSADWVKKQAAMAFDNPVDKARQSKIPTMVDFGASGCKPCDMMSPILTTLGKKYEGKANVIFIHVREQQILASRYGIQSIPVQIFFDKDGKEVFRHAGFFPQEEIEKKLKEVGVQ